MFATLLSGCTQQNTEGLTITVIGRDSTSGTREFFWEHVMEKTDFTPSLLDKSSNGAVQQTVAQTPGAIGYVGLGYVDNTVKAITIDGIQATVDNVHAGTYPIARNLYMYTKGEATNLANEYITYFQSTQGQIIVQDEGFVTLTDTTTYNSTGKTPSGELSISGSTTVLPIAEKIATAFMDMYPDVTIIISGGGSGAGISSVSQGTVDIGMSSRELKESESNLGLTKYTIASDGIAIIVNPSNTYADNLTTEQLKKIYQGEITNWNDL